MPLALALAFSWAGCVDRGAPTGGAIADGDEPSSPWIPLVVADDEAAIDGVVLSDSYEPLDGATIELRGGDRSVTSDRFGRFAFLGLQPGTYTLVAAREGYAPSSTALDAAAGQAASVQLILTALVPSGPYFTQPLELGGFIACGLGFSPVNPESCGAAGLNQDPSHRVAFSVPVAENLTGIVFEMSWEARGEFAGTNLRAHLLEPAGATFVAAGTSPIVVKAEAENQTFTAEPQNLTFDVRVAAGTNPVQGGTWSDAGGVVLNQPFTVYLTFFYRGHAVPEGYTALPEA